MPGRRVATASRFVEAGLINPADDGGFLLPVADARWSGAAVECSWISFSVARGPGACLRILILC
jgi:hypothetical protein